jgi:hypothetical protein
MERYLTEGAVMIAFAIYLLDTGATAVNLHPDGEHGKQYDPKASLAEHGFRQICSWGTTRYGGNYSRGEQTVTINPKAGQGDVVAQIGERTLVAECKGGVVNSRHPGQLSRLRRGLCEAVGLLMTRQRGEGRHVAVVPATAVTRALARRMIARTLAAGIEIALVDGHGSVTFVEPVTEET